MLAKIKLPKLEDSLFNPRLLAALGKSLSIMERGAIVSFFVGIAVFLIAFFTIILKKDSALAIFLLDYSSGSNFPYPLTMQNVMYVFSFAGLGELTIRWTIANAEHSHLFQDLLPEDDHTVFQMKELGGIRQKVKGTFDNDNGFLPFLIDQCILQFQASRDIGQAVNVLNSSLELINHRVDLRYSMLRYLVWLIPTIGFIGTVVGIAGALNLMDPDDLDLRMVTQQLGLAFNTTMIALFLSAVLVFFLHVVQKREEMAVNLAGDYCLKNLVNRLYVEK